MPGTYWQLLENMQEEFQQILSVTKNDNDFSITVLMVDDQEIIAKSVQRMLKD